jgi:Amt family ammonium transporter
VSASTATLTWMAAGWLTFGRPSALGAATGAIAGLAAVTPASGFVGPVRALLIGLVSGVGCWWASTRLKNRLGYDDSLDVFGVHGLGGFIGVVMVGALASPAFGGNQEGLVISRRLAVQLLAAVITIAYTVLGTWVSLLVVRALLGLRVTDQQEIEGLDIVLHDESGYDL